MNDSPSLTYLFIVYAISCAVSVLPLYLAGLWLSTTQYPDAAYIAYAIALYLYISLARYGDHEYRTGTL